MKYSALLLACFLLACQTEDRALDEQNIETTVRNLHISLKNAYATRALDTDSLLNEYYDPDAYYVTPWATSEVMDSTKSRLRTALPLIADYEYTIESFSARSYGRGAYAFYVFRQEYTIDGVLQSEYLPTTLILEKRGERWKIVHAHRSTDPERWSQLLGVQQ